MQLNFDFILIAFLEKWGEFMQYIISVISGKGGVGKTTVSINIAHRLARYNIKTLLVDCDVNTSGATMFYKLAGLLPKDLHDVISIRKIIQSLIDKDLFDNKISSDDLSGIKIDKNLAFIPAVNDLDHPELADYSKEDLEKIKKSFYDLLQIWNSKYNVIIFDHSAGYNNLINFMLEASTKIFLIREQNILSVEASRGVFGKIKSLSIPIVGCVNKISDEEYKNAFDEITGLIPEITAFIYDENISQKTAQGELLYQNINIGNSNRDEYVKTLDQIITFLLPEFSEIKDNYDEEMRKKEEKDKEKQSIQKMEEKRRQLEQEEIQERRRYRRLKSYFRLLHAALILVCFILALIITLITGKGIRLFLLSFLGCLVLLVCLSLYICDKRDLLDELGKYYSEILHKVLNKINLKQDSDDEDD